MSLADAVANWQPGTVQLARRVDPWPAAAFAGLIGAAEPRLADGDPLPPLWHWLTLLEHPASSGTGPDGHPAGGPFWPPIPGRKRMFAGGRLSVHAPVPAGSLLASSAAVTAVNVKQGRSGEMAFVTVRTELTADGVPAATEEQDIVYRSEPEGAPVRATPRPATGEPDPAGDWRAELAADEVLLFRFSALTYNAHRIHYDRTYATQAEGYPDLVIHGPLLALLALELPRAAGRAVRSFSYRLARPAFLPATLIAAGQLQAGGERAEITVAARGAQPSLTATAVLGP